MTDEHNRDDKPVSDRLHPLVYMAVVGLALWLIVSVWGFAGAGDADYLLAVVSLFIVIAVTVPLTLWRVWQKNNTANLAEKRQSFRDWASIEFATSQGRRKGANAAIEILVPLAAVAFGMTAFAIALHFAAHGAA
jgi:hypothetical protein